MPVAIRVLNRRSKTGVGGHRIIRALPGSRVGDHVKRTGRNRRETGACYLDRVTGTKLIDRKSVEDSQAVREGGGKRSVERRAGMIGIECDRHRAGEARIDAA